MSLRKEMLAYVVGNTMITLKWDLGIEQGGVRALSVRRPVK